MRDINRIEPFCMELIELWKKQPDMRFGQFMSNILGEIASKSNRDPFFIEDSEFMNLTKEIPWLKDKN